MSSSKAWATSSTRLRCSMLKGAFSDSAIDWPVLTVFLICRVVSEGHSKEKKGALTCRPFIFLLLNSLKSASVKDFACSRPV